MFDLCHNNTPVVLLETVSSPDVRDKIAKRFVEALGHTSQWCEILPTGENGWIIFPISPSELRVQAMHMINKANELEGKVKQYGKAQESKKK